VPPIHYVPCHEIRRNLQPDEIPLDPTLPQMFVLRNPEYANNYESVTEEAHYCTVLLLQQCGLYMLIFTAEF